MTSFTYLYSGEPKHRLRDKKKTVEFELGSVF